MIRWLPILLLGLALSSKGAAETADGVDPHVLAAWLSEQTKGGLPKVPELRRIRLHVTLDATIPPAELARLRDEVPRRPDHPERQKLQDFERWLKSGPDRFEYVYARSGDMFFFNQERISAPDPVVAVRIAINPQETWWRTAGILLVRATGQPLSAPLELPKLSIQFRNYWFFIAGPMRLMRERAPDDWSIQLANDRFEAIVRGGDNAGSWRVLGKIQSGSAWVITEVVPIDERAGEYGFRFPEGWRPSLDTYSGLKMDLLHRGQFSERVEVVTVDILTTDDFSALTELPDLSAGGDSNGGFVVRDARIPEVRSEIEAGLAAITGNSQAVLPAGTLAASSSGPSPSRQAFNYWPVVLGVSSIGLLFIAGVAIRRARFLLSRRSI